MMIMVNVCHCLTVVVLLLLLLCLCGCELFDQDQNIIYCAAVSSQIDICTMVFKRRKRPEISKPMNFQHIRKTYFDIHSQTLKDLPPQWTSILTDEDITRTAVAAYEKQKQQQQHQYYSHHQPRPKPLIGDACFLTPSDLEYLKVNSCSIVDEIHCSFFFVSSPKRSYVARTQCLNIQVHPKRPIACNIHRNP